jgi:signal transduction histidine kinase
MEHTPDGGTVTVEGRETGIYTEIVVRDTGPGISPEDLPRIFDRFYKGKNSDDKSFGIGLALARMIVAGQRGTVKAENLPGGGAKFTLKFYKSVL